MELNLALSELILQINNFSFQLDFLCLTDIFPSIHYLQKNNYKAQNNQLQLKILLILFLFCKYCFGLLLINSYLEYLLQYYHNLKF